MNGSGSICSMLNTPSPSQTPVSIIAAQIIPCTLEFLDRVTVQCVEDFAKIGLPTDVEAVRVALADGTIDMVATDHAPHADARKAQGLERAPLRRPGKTELRSGL